MISFLSLDEEDNYMHSTLSEHRLGIIDRSSGNPKFNNLGKLLMQDVLKNRTQLQSIEGLGERSQLLQKLFLIFERAYNSNKVEPQKYQISVDPTPLNLWDTYR